MPGRRFARGFASLDETITVVSPGFTTGTDANNNPIRVAAANTTVAEVLIEPVSGTSRLLPEAIRNEASYQATVPASAAARAALVAGRTITRANGDTLKLLWMGDYGGHLVIALAKG
jgi:hypothetical protein